MNKPNLPESFGTPAALIWVFILPQVVLLLINCHACWLVGPEARESWLAVGACEAAMIGLAVALWWQSFSRGAVVPAKMSVLLMCLNIIYLYIFMNGGMKLVPMNIDRWIIDQGDLFLSQATFMMPGIFYGVVRISCHKLEIDEGRLPVFILGGIFLMPMLLLGTVMVFGDRYAAFSFVPFFIFAAVCLFFMQLFVRFVMATYQSLVVKGALENSILRILLAASGPAMISLFIKVFQVWTGPEGILLFVLVSINGILMILPPLRNPGSVGWGLFLRSVTFLVTAYFFLIVLPFLPLGILAVLFFGFGFLAWIPVALFLVHTKALMDDWKAAVAGLGLRRAVMFVCAGLLVLPLFFGVQVVKDKIVLKQALEYVYSSEGHGDLKFPGAAQDVARTMRALKQFKEGDGLPYLSDLYNAIVFEGMVLPDEKISYVYKLFSGEELPEVSVSSYWGRSSRMRAGTGWRAPHEREVNIVAEGVASVKPSSDLVQSTLSLSMAWAPKAETAVKEDQYAWQFSGPRDFYQTIDLPPGVLITGFRLKVGDAMVPGRIFEKKTAMWVYDQIKNTRRDPGLLAYQSPTRVELKVFPVLQNETRQVEIDFLYPEHFYPAVRLNGRPVVLTAASADAPSAGVVGASALILPGGVIARLPALARKPYFHFIIDRSAQASMGSAAYEALIRSVAAQYPGIRKAKLTEANFEARALSSGFVDVRDAAYLGRAFGRVSLPLRGSLDLQRVIQNAVLEYKETCLDRAGSDCWQEYPLFVVLTGAPQNVLPFSEKMDVFKRYIPEAGQYLIIAPNKGREQRPLWSASEASASDRVVLLRQGSRVSAVSSDARGYTDRLDTGRVEVYDPGAGGFKPLEKTGSLLNDEGYEHGLELIFRNEAAMASVRLMDKEKPWLVEQSRKLGVLTPATAYMVVERDAQWRGLKDKEKQMMAASDVFDFEKTPEVPQNSVNSPAPSWLLLVLALVFWMGLRRWRLSTVR